MAAAGAELVAVPVDADGLCVDEGQRRAPAGTLRPGHPSQQSPTGVALSLARRLALLDEPGRRWIIEDDYDSEFRYAGFPLPALKSLDQEGRVLYSGTFSKVLFPCCASATWWCRRRCSNAVRSQQIFSAGCSELPQATLCDFLVEGHLPATCTRTLYAERRQIPARRWSSAWVPPWISPSCPAACT
jgi:GntR family transcriptional regulator/MocR family aminotransferase